MADLREPAKDLAQKIMEEVDFDRRLLGYRVNPRLGFIEVPLYSLGEVVELLHDRAYIDPEKLETWIRDILGDHELAGRLRDRVAGGWPELSKLEPVRELLRRRILQCRKIAE